MLQLEIHLKLRCLSMLLRRNHQDTAKEGSSERQLAAAQEGSLTNLWGLDSWGLDLGGVWLSRIISNYLEEVGQVESNLHF